MGNQDPLKNVCVETFLSKLNYNENGFRFVNPSMLRTLKGEPLSPTEMQKRIFEQCEDARNALLKVLSF